METIRRNEVWERRFTLSQEFSVPLSAVQIDLVIDGPKGHQLIPAFWAGGKSWGVRYSSATPGSYLYRCVCEQYDGDDFDELSGEFEVIEHQWDHPIKQHGRICAEAGRRYLTHEDGTPFFWMADTWWMGLCKRLDWPIGFQTLALDRVKKGFNVVQIVAGLYPDMPAFDARGANEAGFPWTESYDAINPDYYEYADQRIQCLVELGIVPCIVGCWGYYLSLTGVEFMKSHWRNLIARWGAYPVIWCLAGEATMPFYLSENKIEDAKFLKHGWTEIARYVKQTDPFGNIVTIHPTDNGRNQLEDASLLDMEMLQTGHANWLSLKNTVDQVRGSYESTPVMPVINSEVSYEGIGEASRQEVQRYMFWDCILSGAAGHTYGANGLWQLNTRQQPYGPSPHGISYGDTPWEDAYQLPGSTHVALGKRILEGVEWWNMAPHPEWCEPHISASDRIESYFAPICAGIPERLRVIYTPPVWASSVTIKGIEAGINYQWRLVSPVDGSVFASGAVEPDEQGTWSLSYGKGDWKLMPVLQDWVLILTGTPA
ncbi:MAG: apiosidase-like domain-containing protein [Armatimonadota bacterium]